MTVTRPFANWSLTARTSLWLTWLLAMLWLAGNIIFDSDSEALLRSVHMGGYVFPLLWIASGTGLWLLLGLSEGINPLTSVILGIAASVMGFVVGMPVLTVLVYVAEVVFRGFTR